MYYLQIDEQGGNGIIKQFLDQLEKDGVECKLDITLPNVNEVKFTLITRLAEKDLIALHNAIDKYLTFQEQDKSQKD